jgi:hypothetical protein
LLSDHSRKIASNTSPKAWTCARHRLFGHLQRQILGNIRNIFVDTINPFLLLAFAAGLHCECSFITIRIWSQLNKHATGYVENDTQRTEHKLAWYCECQLS